MLHPHFLLYDMLQLAGSFPRVFVFLDLFLSRWRNSTLSYIYPCIPLLVLIMPTAELKLTKKQKKALAFRSRTKKLNQTHGATSQAETLQHSALEDEDHSSEERLPLEVGCVEEESTSIVGSDVKGKTRMDREVKSTQAQKRKRETSDDDGQEKKKIRKKESSASATSQSKKGRFILFVGNYPLPVSFLSRTDVYIYRQSQIYH